MEFRNALLTKVCAKYNIKQTFTVAYHPSSNGLIERANRKILEALRHVVTSLHDNPQVAACINGSHLRVFIDIHKKVREKLLASRNEMMQQQHKRAAPITFKGDTMMLQMPLRESK
ncbi:hypothetical protein E2C01_026419 [Portunus trituberculatus]|uniref:Integrase catalytic domain-containing protein n=1 Tax=Portunus trituberculatus TaxID=210409 RepID=A0A5B7EIT8_PORTR|nr:hypothetical protein [Portunus trituberculatus]